MNIVRKLKSAELPILTQLFNYNDIDDMISENTRNIENDIVDIFAMLDNDKLIGELHVKYDNEDKDFAEKKTSISVRIQNSQRLSRKRIRLLSS